MHHLVLLNCPPLVQAVHCWIWGLCCIGKFIFGQCSGFG